MFNFFLNYIYFKNIFLKLLGWLRPQLDIEPNNNCRIKCVYITLRRLSTVALLKGETYLINYQIIFLDHERQVANVYVFHHVSKHFLITIIFVSEVLKLKCGKDIKDDLSDTLESEICSCLFIRSSCVYEPEF